MSGGLFGDKISNYLHHDCGDCSDWNSIVRITTWCKLIKNTHLAHGTQVFNNFKKFKLLCNSVYVQGSWNLQFMAMVMQLILENNQVNIISPGDWNNDINFKIIHGKFHCFDVHFLEIFVQVIEIFLAWPI